MTEAGFLPCAKCSASVFYFWVWLNTHCRATHTQSPKKEKKNAAGPLWSNFDSACFMLCSVRCSRYPWVMQLICSSVIGRPNPNSRNWRALVITPWPSPFVTGILSPDGRVHAFLVRRYCLLIHSSWPSNNIGHSPSFSLMLKFPPNSMVLILSWKRLRPVDMVFNHVGTIIAFVLVITIFRYQFLLF